MSWNVHIVEGPNEADAARLNAFIAASPAGHLYQYPLLDRIEEGPPIRRICAWAERGGIVAATAIARLRRARGIGPLIARIDRGPVVGDLEALRPLLDALSERLREVGAVSLRVNPQHRRDQDGGITVALQDMGFTGVQDDDYDVTLEVDIDHDRETLLGSFAKGTRYAIRQGAKAGVQCGPASAEADVQALEALYAEMVQRKGATRRPAGFFREIAAFLAADPRRGFILASRYREDIVGAIVVTRYGPRALYTFGASKEADDGVPKTHLLHFEAMVAARALGCTRYDLGGFSAGVGEEGSRTAAQSINFFKSRFTKNAVALVPCHERVLRPVLHRLVGAAKRLAKAGP